MPTLVIPLNEVLQNVFGKIIHVHKEGVYSVKNNKIDNFPALLYESGFVDRAGYSTKWRQRCFEGNKGYSHFTSYRLHFIFQDPASTQDVLTELGTQMFVGQATTRELLAFSVTYKKVVETLLLQGKIISAIGQDEFCANCNTVPILFLDGVQKVLGCVPLFSSQWSSRHVFLSR